MRSFLTAILILSICLFFVPGAFAKGKGKSADAPHGKPAYAPHGKSPAGPKGKETAPGYQLYRVGQPLHPGKHGSNPKCDPSFDGLYSDLIMHFTVPYDNQKHGNCKNKGRSSLSSYQGFSDLPEGYWTYSHPHWYIWGKRSGDDKKTSFKAPKYCDPTMGGKYSSLLFKLAVPGDRDEYGSCKDKGTQSLLSYRGILNLPGGHWTYSYPYWYIWGVRR
ncbi:MAG: hypothetical protein IH874_05620 [Candidatus Dadabacteria bacterium]|nr:hypothetical protein [Candidatus Dadabacteria bacterium]